MKSLQDSGAVVLRSTQLKPAERKSLLDNGFIRQIIKGWYMPTRPGEAHGDTTPWYAAVRNFIREYCKGRFGDEWHLSPELSILIHAGNTALPEQIVIHSPLGKNNVLALPDGYSLLDYMARDFAGPTAIEEREGLNVLRLPVALTRIPEVFFSNYSNDVLVALHQISDASELNRQLLAGGHSVVAARLSAAFRAIGREDIANDIRDTMRAAGYTHTETNPFEKPVIRFGTGGTVSPYVLRMRVMWDSMRRSVVKVFPKEPGVPLDAEEYLRRIEETYITDAYHSLSIEGYQVTDDLINRVSTGQWNPEMHSHDADARNAMAAHGYWRAFTSVKQSIRNVLKGDPPGVVLHHDLGAWYRELFSPAIDAGLLAVTDLAGYRSQQVYIKNVAHIPPSAQAVREMMPELFNLLSNESNSGVRAVLGHFLFVYIHPYSDGNGRLGRFLMNVMLASGGYTWTIIPVERRSEYLDTLNSASSKGDIVPFARFVKSCMERTDVSYS